MAAPSKPKSFLESIKKGNHKHIKMFQAYVRRMCREYYNQYYQVRIGQKDPKMQILEACRTFKDEDKVVRKP